jgi:hypothetical protein
MQSKNRYKVVELEKVKKLASAYKCLRKASYLERKCSKEYERTQLESF